MVKIVGFDLIRLASLSTFPSQGKAWATFFCVGIARYKNAPGEATPRAKKLSAVPPEFPIDGHSNAVTG